MLLYCRDKWDKNKEKLEQAILQNKELHKCDYQDLVKMVVKYILNPNSSKKDKYNENNITVIDNGDYQGTLLFMIPRDIYQPTASEYLLTYISYGSCAACDLLKDLKMYYYDYQNEFAKHYINDYMMLCKDIVCNIVKPYNSGWREDERYKEIAK